MPERLCKEEQAKRPEFDDVGKINPTAQLPESRTTPRPLQLPPPPDPMRDYVREPGSLTFEAETGG